MSVSKLSKSSGWGDNARWGVAGATFSDLVPPGVAGWGAAVWVETGLEGGWDCRERGSCQGQNSGLKLARGQPAERWAVGAKPKPSAHPEGMGDLGGGAGRVDEREQAAILGTDPAKVLPRAVFAMWLTNHHTSTPAAGNGNPPQYSWLGNPMDRGAWWPTLYRIHNLLPEHPHLFLALTENWLSPGNTIPLKSSQRESTHSQHVPPHSSGLRLACWPPRATTSCICP